MGKGRREFPVSTVRVSPTVWREALRAADGNPRRLRIVSATRVEVLPEPAEGRRKRAVWSRPQQAWKP